MSWLNTIVREVFGLFVDDLGFAAAIIIWLSIVWLLVARAGLPSGYGGALLFVGLAAILIESTVRFARRR